MLYRMIKTGPLTSLISAMLPSGHHPPALGSDLQLGQVVDLLAEIGLALHVDLPGSAEQVEVVDVQRAQVDLQRIEQLGDRDAQQPGLGAVDVEVEPGRVGPEAGEEPAQVLGGASACRERRSRWRRPGAPAGPGRRGLARTILNPPAVPRPSTGGASKTLISPSPICFLQLFLETGRRSPGRRARAAARWWKSSSITYIAPKLGALAFKRID